MKIGAHMSVAGGFENAISSGLEIDCEAVQLFVKSNRSWTTREVYPEEFETFKNARSAQSSISSIFCHGTYLVNLAAEDPAVLEKSIMCFELEYDLCTKLGLDYLVFHPGAPKKMGGEKGIAQIVESLNGIAAKFPDSPVKILLENTAGQGSTIGRKFSELKQILDILDDQQRYGVCFDTCHAFCAGYDITKEDTYDKVMNEFDGEIGLDRLLAFHLNDAENELGSNKDRHAHIGEGNIGVEGFRWLMNDSRFTNHPGALETPDSEKFPQDLEKLKGLRA
ncbi:MAG TPA: deoxyribonuclease IV [Candidatus Lokiarchaeia archaeon]|nr:deoxyribonuclease IV [Candidatus Lokiarchaeia archaeon]